MFQPTDGNTDPNNLQGQQIGYVRLTQLANDFLEVTKSQVLAFKNSAEYLTKMDQNMGSLVRSMGVTREYSQLLKQELGRAVTEVTSMGGKQEDINTLQKEFIEATNRTIVLSTENIEKLFAVSKVTGVAAKTLETSFRNAGMETTHIEEEMRTVYNTANSMGVNAQVVSSMVVSNLDKMNRFGFGTGVEGMAKMAAKAAAMRVDMNTTLNLADKLFSPEAAMDVASTLQRLGATSSALLDPLKLMDLAQNNVPELQNQLSELSKTFTTFDKATGKFQIMPEARRQLKEVADALGIDRVEFEKMALESAKMEKKLGEINFRPLGNITEDEKMMIANLSEFNKARGDYTVKFTSADGKVLEKTLSELNESDKLALKEQQNLKEPQKELVDVAKQQLSYTETLVNQNASLNATIQTQYAITKEGQDYLKSAVEAQTKAYEVGFSNYSLDKSNKREFGTTTYETLTKLNKGELQMTDEAISTLITNIGLGIGENYIDVATQLGEKIEQNPFNAALGSVVSKMEIVDKTLTTVGVDLKAIGDVLTTAAVEFPIIKSVLKFITGSNPPEETKPPTVPDVVVNANGRMFTLDKGDLLMGVNQQMLAQSIGASGQVFANNTTPETKTSPKEIKISLDVTANSNDPQIKNAILSAFNNDDTLRTLREKIGVVGSDYGLTAT